MGESALKIALTGAMGSGKSLVAELFREQGARTIDADQVSRRLLMPAAAGWCALRAEFGDRFFTADLTVDRQKLRAAIFSDEALRKKINAILHPLIRQAIVDLCREKVGLKGDSADSAGRPPITVVEVPLLFEVGWQNDFDLVIAVTADEDICLDRIVRRDQVARPAALAAFATQMSPAEKAAMADYLIDNSGSLEATARQVRELYAILIA
jgi:dephospho-CoA kinase